MRCIYCDECGDQPPVAVKQPRVSIASYTILSFKLK